MVFQGEKHGLAARWLRGLLFSLVLTGCADKPFVMHPVTNPPAPAPVLDQHAVVGGGTAQDKDRAAIDASNQQMFEVEHATSPAPTDTTTVAPAPEAPTTPADASAAPPAPAPASPSTDTPVEATGSSSPSPASAPATAPTEQQGGTTQ